MTAMELHRHYYLICGCLGRIPLPRPTQLDTHGNPLAITKDSTKEILACPDCGLVRAYSAQDLQWQMLPIPDPFLSKQCVLVSLEVECDGKNCVAPKAVHTILGTDKGQWRPKVVPKDFQFSSDARCGDDHQLIGNWHNPKIAWEVVSGLW